MGDTTGISWTDATVNFWWGCTKVGPGCDHCYAETWSKRTGGDLWGVGAPRRKIKGAAALIMRLNGKHSGSWQAQTGRRQRVFIQSMSDLFDNEVDLAWFREAWEHIEFSTNLEIQIVTKRISMVQKRLAAIGRTTWPKHVGLMVTVCNQEEAERDVPRLLEAKAALGIPWVGISAEPLLGAIDFSPWLENNPIHEKQAERRVRLSGRPERRLGDNAGRHDLEAAETRVGSLEENGRQSALQTGEGGARLRGISSGQDNDRRSEGVRLGSSFGLSTHKRADPAGNDGEPRGRKEEAQSSNELGVGDIFRAADSRDARIKSGTRLQPAGGKQLDGDFVRRAGEADKGEADIGREASVNRDGLRSNVPDNIADSARGQTLDFIIVGGESGAGARPMHPDWARSIRDQCAGVGVPFHFKQWGEWQTADCLPDNWVESESPLGAHGEDFTRIGKRRAGRLLDGVEHNEFPRGA